MWDKLKEQLNILKLEKKKLFLITNSDKFLSKDEFLDAIASALQGGVDILMLREKIIPDNVIVELGHKIRTLCDEYGTTFIINDRADIAHIVEADGVHLGENDISVPDAREVLGHNAIIGKTVTNPDDVIQAVNDGADYVIIVNNDSIDFEMIKWIYENIDIPTFVTGAIGLDDTAELVARGVQKIAITKPIMYAKSPEHAARGFLRHLP